MSAERKWAKKPSTISPEQVERDALGVDLLTRVASSDRAAFAKLYDTFGGILYSLALRMMGDPLEAEEVTQETFLKLWKRAGQYRSDEGRPVTWMLTVTRNTARDRLRSNRRRENLHVRIIDQSPKEKQRTDAEANPVIQEVWDSEKAESVQKALKKLPSKQRIAINLAFFDGLSQSEIAAELDLPLGTVKGRIRRGMATMHQYLTEFAPAARQS